MFCIRYSRSFKVYHQKVTDNPPIIYANKIEKRITFKIKTRYFLQLLTPGTIKLLGSTKIAKDDNGKNVSHSEIT